ncbi:MAG: hypothetical protein Q8T13_23810 [Acidobacteriota bacterium]|nr:hypothetical protein [Acidobacteriota bacterium]
MTGELMTAADLNAIQGAPGDLDVDLFGNVPTIDTGVRSTGDFYETPKFMTRSLVHYHRAIVRSIPLNDGTKGQRAPVILECCSGNDAIAVVLREEYGLTVHTNDIDPRHPAETHEDATQAAYWQRWRGGMGERPELPAIDWVVTNPTFVNALPILQHAISVAQVGVAFLLRKTFLEPTEDRGPWLAQFPPTREIGQPRYSFRGSGNDSVSCDWMIWERYPDRRLGRVIDHTAEDRVRRPA